MLLLNKKITGELYDMAILGGGVAGLAAAVTAGQLGLRTLVMEKAVYGGSVAVLETITGVPGIAEISGWDYTQNMVRQAENIGCLLLDSIEVTGVQKLENNRFEIQCSDGNHFHSKTVIITTGGQPRLLDLEDEQRFAQRGIHTCAQCAGARYSGRDVAIAGNGSWAVQAAYHLLHLGCRVIFISGDAEMIGNVYLINRIFNNENFHFLAGHHVVKLSGGDYLEKIEVKSLTTSELKHLDVAAVFVYRGVDPDIKNIEARQDAKGFFIVDANFMTSLPGLFATGRVVYEDLPVQILVGDGSRAALAASSWLQANG